MADQFPDDKVYGTFEGYSELKKLQDIIIDPTSYIDLSDEEHTEKSVVFQKFTTLVHYSNTIS